jgi:hypothetical protein
MDGAGNGVDAGDASWAKMGAAVKQQRTSRRIRTDDFMAASVKEIGAAVNESC